MKHKKELKAISNHSTYMLPGILCSICMQWEFVEGGGVSPHDRPQNR